MNNNTEFNNFNLNNDSNQNLNMNQNPNTVMNQNINSNPSMGMNSNVYSTDSNGMSKSSFNKNKNNIFKVLVIIVVVILAIIIIKNLFSNDNASISVSKNQTLVECGTHVNVAGEKTRTELKSYVLENDKVVKVINSEIYYLDVPSNTMTEDQIEQFKSETESACDSYPNGECEVTIDYKKNQTFKYDLTVTGSLLNDINNSIVGLSEQEIFEKIENKEKQNALSCEIK